MSKFRLFLSEVMFFAFASDQQVYARLDREKREAQERRDAEAIED